MTDWIALTARAGRAGHDLVGWLMWDPDAIAAYEALGVPNGAGWIQAWRLAPLGDISPAAAAAATFSIHPDVVAMILGMWRGVTDAVEIDGVRNAAVEPGLESVAPGLGAELAPLADDLWRGGRRRAPRRPSAVRCQPGPGPTWPRRAGVVGLARRQLLATSCGVTTTGCCVRRPISTNVEAGLLHSVMVDPEEYGSEEWIARSRGADDEAVARGWARLEAKGYATAGAVNDAGRRFRLDLERRTDELTAPAWQAVGEAATVAFCDAVDAHHDAFVARIDATAGPRWMPAVRTRHS